MGAGRRQKGGPSGRSGRQSSSGPKGVAWLSDSTCTHPRPPSPSACPCPCRFEDFVCRVRSNGVWHLAHWSDRGLVAGDPGLGGRRPTAGCTLTQHIQSCGGRVHGERAGEGRGRGCNMLRRVFVVTLGSNEVAALGGARSGCPALSFTNE